MPLELYLVGTIHPDLQGPQRLQRLLPRISPDVVSVEFDQQTAIQLDQLQQYKQSPQGMQALADHWCGKGNYNPENARQFISLLGFEYFVSKEYCRQQNKLLIFSDLGDTKLAEQHLQYALSNSLETIRQQTEITYQNPVIEVPVEHIPNLMRRDAYTETILRALSGKVLHIAGAWHLSGNYHNLYERLRDLNPIRIMLNQADHI